jgi:hypothetical protein
MLEFGGCFLVFDGGARFRWQVYANGPGLASERF